MIYMRDRARQAADDWDDEVDNAPLPFCYKAVLQTAADNSVRFIDSMNPMAGGKSHLLSTFLPNSDSQLPYSESRDISLYLRQYGL